MVSLWWQMKTKAYEGEKRRNKTAHGGEEIWMDFKNIEAGMYKKIKNKKN